MSELELRLVRIQNRWKFPEGFPLLPLWLSAVKNCSSESSNSSRPGILRATSGAVKPPLNFRKPNARWGGKAPFVAMVNGRRPYKTVPERPLFAGSSAY